MTTGKVFGAGDLQDHLGRVGLLQRQVSCHVWPRYVVVVVCTNTHFGSFETPPLSIVGVMFVVEIVQLIKSFDDGTWRLEANAGNSSNRPLSRSPSCV
jgi:hypothetical protein